MQPLFGSKMSRLKKLERTLKIVTEAKKLKGRARKLFLEKNNFNKNTFRKESPREDLIKKQIAFEKTWRILLEQNFSQFSKTDFKRFEEFVNQQLQQSEFSIFKKEFEQEIAQLSKKHKKKTPKGRRVKTKSSNIEPLKRLHTFNPNLEEPRTEFNFDNFTVERIFGLGYISPFKKSKKSAPPLRLRMDIVILQGPWRDISEGNGSIVVEVANDLFSPLEIGNSKTHKTGIILLVLTPCFIEVESSKYQSPTVLLPTEFPLIVDWTTHEPSTSSWHVLRDLPLEKLAKDLAEVGKFKKDTPNSKDKYPSLEKDSLLHPDNLKTTLERYPEIIFTLRQRISNWENLTALNNDKFFSSSDWKELFKNYLNRYSTIPSFPSKNFQNYWEENYKQGKSRLSFQVIKDNDCKNRGEFKTELETFQNFGLHTRVMLLSEFFNWSSEEDLLLMLGNNLHNHFPRYLHQRELLRTVHYQEELPFNLYQRSPTFLLHSNEGSTKQGFGYVRIVVLDEALILKFFELGVYLFKFNGKTCLDIYGTLPNCALSDLSSEKLESFINLLIYKFKRIFFENFYTRLPDSLEVALDSNGKKFFRYFCLNPKYWSPSKQSGLKSKEEIRRMFEQKK